MEVISLDVNLENVRNLQNVRNLKNKKSTKRNKFTKHKSMKLKIRNKTRRH